MPDHKPLDLTKDFTREQIVMLYTIFTLESLKSMGIVGGGGISMAPEAEWLCRQLRVVGFVVNEDETAEAVRAIQENGDEEIYDVDA
jgi:hypothetical protein